MTSSRAMALEISLVIPCLNEEAGIAFCIEEAKTAFEKLGIAGEIIVVDNGSTDASAAIARSLDARVIYERQRGYGCALRAGFAAAKADYIIIGDADGSHKFTSESIAPYINGLHNGAACVVGNRFGGIIEKGSMKRLHIIAIHIMSWLFNLQHGVRLHDVTCGMRGFRKAPLMGFTFFKNGLEFSIEIISVYTQSGAPITEVASDMRARLGGNSKLNPWRDVWKHLLVIFTTPKPRSYGNYW
jgi:glycosyltransferase involved in cell wall biosynthesis